MIDIFNESSIIDSVGITSEDVGIYKRIQSIIFF